MYKLWLVLLEVGEGQVHQEQTDEDIKGERQCHQPGKEEPEELAWDDVNDCEPDPIEAREARKAEMGNFTRMNVYRKVPRQRCHDLTGNNPINVRWTDADKQDTNNPECRYSLAPTSSNCGQVLSYVLQHNLSPRFVFCSVWLRHVGLRRRVMINDAARAYVNAPSLTPTFVEICDEEFAAGDEDMCVERRTSVYVRDPPSRTTLAEVLHQAVDRPRVSSRPLIHLHHDPRGEAYLQLQVDRI